MQVCPAELALGWPLSRCACQNWGHLYERYASTPGRISPLRPILWYFKKPGEHQEQSTNPASSSVHRGAWICLYRSWSLMSQWRWSKREAWRFVLHAPLLLSKFLHFLLITAGVHMLEVLPLQGHGDFILPKPEFFPVIHSHFLEALLSYNHLQNRI